jgi:hypothetical protein
MQCSVKKAAKKRMPLKLQSIYMFSLILIFAGDGCLYLELTIC